MMATGGDCGASKALVQRLLYPGSPWPEKYPELRAVSTDHPCNASRDVIANNRWSLAPGYPEETWSFFSNDPKVPWDDDTNANLRAWTTIVRNNTALKGDDGGPVRGAPSVACADTVDRFCGDRSNSLLSACYKAQHDPSVRLLAAFSTSDGGSTKAWRCYAPYDLNGPHPAAVPLLDSALTGLFPPH